MAYLPNTNFTTYLSLIYSCFNKTQIFSNMKTNLSKKELAAKFLALLDQMQELGIAVGSDEHNYMTDKCHINLFLPEDVGS